MASQDSTLYIRFFAKCSVLLGIPSLVWAIYIFWSYPVDPWAVSKQLAGGLALTLGGLFVLLCVPSPKRSEPWFQRGKTFIGSRLDGLVFYLSIFASFVGMFFLPFCISNYLNALPANEKYIPVKVRVESIEVKHVSAEQLPEETFYAIYKEVYYVLASYEELWVASGIVTLVEQEGRAIEPEQRSAIFTIPHMERYVKGGTNPQTTSNLYIEHHKMDAVIDSQKFEVGKMYLGWLLRDQNADVFFTRPSDRALKDLLLVASLLSILGIYLFARIRIGLQDRH